MNKVNLKLFIEGYYVGNGQMQPVRYNRDGVSPQNEVETIEVQLHDSTGVVETTVGTLQTDGTLSVDFNTSGSFHLSVRGRNSLQLFTEDAILIEDGAEFDFTTYGSNQKEVEMGVFALYSGDIDGNGTIGQLDYENWLEQYLNYEVGTADLNGDGLTDYADYGIYEANIGREVVVPIGLPNPKV